MSTSNERNPTHVYTQPGVYSVTLTVFGVGGTDSYTRSGYISVSTPQFYISLDGLVPPGSATVTGFGTYPDGAPVTLQATGTAIEPPYFADIVFLVDESGSMDTEHTWLTTLPNTLEAALNAADIGSGSETNQYALVGFGGHIVAGHKHPVGGGDWGTAAECATAAGSLIVGGGGGTEDGYEAMNFALNNYAYRANAAKVFVLITDEDRDDITGGVITKASITSALQTNSVILAICCSITVTDTLAQQCIGRKGTRTFTSTLVAPYYAETVLSTIVAGPDATIPGDNATVIADYVEVAEVVPAAQPEGGSEWDLNQLRNGGSDAVSFTAAFVDIVQAQITQFLTYTFDYWLVNGVPYYTNPLNFNISGNTTVVLYMTPP